MPFDYFDEIRKVLETAQRDVLFVDPYLDAEFVSRYLGHIPAGVSIRLLARERIQTLIPAVELYAKQSNTKIEVPKKWVTLIVDSANNAPTPTTGPRASLNNHRITCFAAFFRSVNSRVSL